MRALPWPAIVGEARLIPGRRIAISANRSVRKGNDMGIIWTIVLGFVIGVIAKLVHPGKENMGFVMTVLLGIAGSFLAGVIGQFLGWYTAGEGAGFIASVIVAIILLVIYGRLRGGASPDSPK